MIALLLCIVVAVTLILVFPRMWRPERERDIADVAKAVTPAVVSISIYDATGEARGLGSGFIVSEDGLIVTNFHVIKEAYSCDVRMASGALYSNAAIVVSDEAADLAVLKVPGNRLPFLALDETCAPSVGEEVVAVGSPLGLEGTVSNGIISAIRHLNGLTILQTTAPISPGNSGGPLVSKKTKVIGVTSALLPQGQNLNFAVSVQHIARLLAKAKK